MTKARPGRAMAEDSHLAEPPVAPLASVGRDDLAFAGGKGANLGELLRSGFAVPDGFVVSTRGYASVAHDAGLADTIAEGLASGDGAGIRAAFAAVAVPVSVRSAIADAYAGLGGGPVAVRSSATAEDLPGAAFAGQQDTYLNVSGETAVLDAVRLCWGSLWTDRAIAYRRRAGIDSHDVRIAVVVQRMIASEFAGVLFTANPVTGDRDEVVVESSRGLGEAVVSGRATPDRHVLDAAGRITQRVPAAVDATHDDVPRTAGQPDRQPPADTVLAELAGVGRSVAHHFGRPQDIEWAYADGIVWLVQARPMTGLPPPPLRLNRIQRITGPQIFEMLPIRPYPLDMSSWTLRGMGRMVERMLLEIPGLRVDFAAMLPESDGVVDRFVPPVPRPTARVLTAPLRLLPRMRRYDPATWMQDPRFARFQLATDAIAAHDPRVVDWSELVALPRQALALLEPIVDLRVDYLPRVGTSLLRLIVTLKLLGLGELFQVLITSAPTRTEDANRALVELAARVRADTTLLEAFTTSDPAALAERVEQDADFGDLRAALRDVLAEYGHRETASPILMSTPTWGDDPIVVLGLVKALVSDPPPPATVGRSQQAMRRLLAHPVVRVTRSTRPVARTVDAARAGIAFRDDTHFHGTRALPILRHALLEVGRRLADAGVLETRTDVLHLRLEELEHLAAPPELPVSEAKRLRDLVCQRAARRAELSGVPMITTGVLFPARADAGGALVSGTPASGGQATGPVRVIRDPAEFGTLRGGDILVCPYTNPAWTPLFQRAAAVVVDLGGLGSHAAIVAREYGIPAVMGTGSGTTVLTDGQVVTVNGDTGHVTARDGDC